MSGRPPLRTPEATRRWRAFYQTRWHRATLARGRCPGCGRKKQGLDLQHERCHQCWRAHAARARTRYREQKDRRQAA